MLSFTDDVDATRNLPKWKRAMQKKRSRRSLTTQRITNHGDDKFECLIFKYKYVCNFHFPFLFFSFFLRPLSLCYMLVLGHAFSAMGIQNTWKFNLISTFPTKTTWFNRIKLKLKRNRNKHLHIVSLNQVTYQHQISKMRAHITHAWTWT